MIIETERLILRRFQDNDYIDFYEYMSLEETAEFENFSPKTEEECKRIIVYRKEQENYFAVVLKENNKLIGNVEYDVEEYDSYSISYDFNPVFKRVGYATEAVKAMVDYIFLKLDGRRIYAECDEGNIASCKLLERLKFRKEGHMIEDVTFKVDEENQPIYVNSYLYAILKREWTND